MARGLNLIGNPYPSSIDWDAPTGWSRPNVNDAIYYRRNGTTCTYIDGTGTNGADGIIPPMQGFYVRATANTTISCDNRVRVHSDRQLYKATTTNTLHLTVRNNSNNLTDDSYIRFKDYASDVFDGSYDAEKMYADDLNYPQVYTNIGGTKDIAINTLSDLTSERIVPLGFKTNVAGNFTITSGMVSSFVNSNYKVYLDDAQTGTSQELSDNSSYSFSSGTTTGTSRFSLHFVPGGSLPIELASFDAKCEKASVNVNWITATEINNDFFTVERSENAANWKLVTTVKGAGNSNTMLSYSIKDNNPVNGNAYYRLKQTDFDGKYTYSNIVSVSCSQTNDLYDNMSLFPNPTTDNITLNFGNEINSKLHISIKDVLGRDVKETDYTASEITFMSINLDELNAGVYYLQIKDITNDILLPLQKFVKK